MNSKIKNMELTIVGGGMITHDLILPTVYQLCRDGFVKNVNICALNNAPLKFLETSDDIAKNFPDQKFTAYPALSEPEDASYPDLYKEVIAKMEPYNTVVVAMPDQLHYSVVMEALKNNQHILCVKPLVLEYEQTIEIEKLALEKGLFIGVEYHKRFDRRSLIAKRDFELGNFGEFVMGEAKMIEPYFYRSSNFQNWFTADKTDPFVYVGCHYIDLVCFITGLKPVEVSVQGVKGEFPNGNIGYMWANGRVVFENGAILSVTDGLGYPDEAAGSNEQCLNMFFEGKGKAASLKHNDQFRGCEYSYLDGVGCAGSVFNYVNPDFFRLVPWEGEGYKPVGYGVDSVAATVERASVIEGACEGKSEEEALKIRQQMIKETDDRGIIATPANSYTNELVMEAARLSILSNGDVASIIYGDKPHVKLRGK